MSRHIVRVDAACCAVLATLALGSASCSRDARASVQHDDTVPAFEQRGNELVVPERSPLRRQLTVAPVAPSRVRHELDVPATAEADPAKIARISPPLEGRVLKLMVQLGDAVARGAPLYTLDSPDLAAAQSDYLKARSAEAQTLRALNRQRDLTEHGIGAKKDLEQAQTDEDQAKSELARATTRLQVLGMGASEVGQPLVVRSPIPGRVIDLSTSPGQYQNDPSAVLMVVADLSTIWVTAQVPEKDIQRVSVGEDARVQFAAYPGEQFSGRVQFVGDVLAPETRTVKVRIQLANPQHRLKPGMFARVLLQGKEVPEILVPPSALLVRGDASYVFVEKASWTLERRAVEVGETLPAGVSVVRGLAAGERIVTANVILLP